MRSVGRCTAFRSCRRRAVYTSPARWCRKHWAMWWAYGVKGREELPYMRDPAPDSWHHLLRLIESARASMGEAAWAKAGKEINE